MSEARSARRRWASRSAAALALGIATTGSAHAQTDYYNLDAGRPLRTEDALVIERHALEWQLAPLRVSGARGRGATTSLEPELAWGILPRTQVELGLPIERRQQGGRVTTGGSGIDFAVLHALNVETTTLPALAIGAALLVPAGAFGGERTYPTFTAIATRTTSLGRVHANASYTAGAAPSPSAGDELARWTAGVAVDHAFPLRSVLVGAELFARSPMAPTADVEWNSAVGLRFQVAPRFAVDAGLGRELSSGGEWFVTFGSALSLSLLHRFGGAR